MKCPNCSQNITNSDNLFYCPFCLTQLKCKNCKEALIMGSIGCAHCGTPIIKNSNVGQLNEIDFEKKGDTLKFKTTFTNEVGTDLVATFGSIVGAQPGTRKMLLSQANKIQNNRLIIDPNATVVEAETVGETDEIVDILQLVLTKDNDKLIFQKNTFKERNKIDKEIRIALLLLLGYKILCNQSEIKRQILTDTLNSYKLNSAGFRKWLPNSEEIAKKSGGLIFLTPDGVDKAIAILKEVVDPNISQGNTSISKPNSGSRKRTNCGDVNTSSKKASTGVTAHLLALLDEGFFKQPKTLGDITNYLEEKKAIKLKSTDVGSPMARLLNTNGLQRRKGNSGVYEYYN